MKAALCDVPMMRQFAPPCSLEEIADETTILNCRRLLEKHQLAAAVFKQTNIHLVREAMLVTPL